MGLLYRNRDVLPVLIRLIIYHSLFLPHVQYCFLVWGTTTQTSIARLTRVQNKIFRIIANVPPDHEIDTLMNHFRLVGVGNLYSCRLCRALNMEKKRNSSHLFSLDKLVINKHVHETRHAEYWKVGLNRTNYGDQMIRTVIPKTLNDFHAKRIDVYKLTAKEIYKLFL